MYIDHINSGFVRHLSDGTVFYSVEAIDRTAHYRHGFFSRLGGVSAPPYDSLNFSYKREKKVQNILANFNKAARVLDIDLEACIMVNYEHGANVAVAAPEHKGMGILRENTLPHCDGMVMNQKDLTVVTLHADCIPLFFGDKSGRAAGAAHAGWRGTQLGMAGNMVSRMERLGADLNEILVGIGPCIGACCFEVRDDTGIPFVKEYGEGVRAFREGRQYIDLVKVTLIQLEQAGIPPENVTVSGLCTSCHPELFFSHRRDKGRTGSMASFIELI